MSTIMNPVRLDAIGELANIASGNAATALSEMTQKIVYLDVPNVKYIDVIDFPDYFDNKEEEMLGVFVNTSGIMDGYLGFLSNMKSSKELADIISGGMDIEPSLVLTEVVNIITGSYVTALSDMLEETIEISPPENVQDMVGSILNSFAAELSMTNEKSLLFTTNLSVDGTDFSAYYLFLMEEDSMNALFEALEEKFNL